MPASDGGTTLAGRQCAPEQPSSHAGSCAGLTSAGPCHGQVSSVGGFIGLSQPSEQAPVGAVGSVAVGLKQGAHLVPVGQPACGSSAACAATAGRQVETQRPSAPAIEVQLLGT